MTFSGDGLGKKKEILGWSENRLVNTGRQGNKIDRVIQKDIS